jgi:hypothetical protein
VVIFSLALVVVEFLAILQISLNKSCKTYLGTILPPGGKKLAADFPSFFQLQVMSRLIKSREEQPKVLLTAEIFTHIF